MYKGPYTPSNPFCSPTTEKSLHGNPKANASISPRRSISSFLTSPQITLSPSSGQIFLVYVLGVGFNREFILANGDKV